MIRSIIKRISLDAVGPKQCDEKQIEGQKKCTLFHNAFILRLTFYLSFIQIPIILNINLDIIIA